MRFMENYGRKKCAKPFAIHPPPSLMTHAMPLLIDHVA